MNYPITHFPSRAPGPTLLQKIAYVLIVGLSGLAFLGLAWIGYVVFAA